MEDQLISFETAKLAKEKGFDIKCTQGYDPDSGAPFTGSMWMFAMRLESSRHTQAPTQSLLQRWLREQHNTCVSIYNNASGFLWNMADTVGGTDRGWSDYSGPNDSGVWDTWEEALEAGLIEALNRINNG